MSLILRWSGVVKGQPRARATRAGGYVRMWTPDTADAMKTGLVAVARKSIGGGNPWPIYYDGPVAVRIDAYFQRPKSHLRKGIVRPDATRKHAQKPDVDNVAKAVLDALTNARVWRDDAQVWSLGVNRFWVDGDCQPGLIVEVIR